MSGAPKDDRSWEAGWEENRRAQRRREAAWSLVEKIRWLDEAQQLAESLRKNRQIEGGSAD